jgi:eukaryotic-like serine/threonine-protein kinase
MTTTQPVPDTTSAYDDPRVVEALERYLALLETGRTPDRAEFLLDYPDIATALDDCLSGLDFLRHSAPTDPTLRMPDTLGEFRLLRELGRGGMGIVYEAEQTSLRRRVALKTLPMANGLQEVDRERFLNESRAAAMLDHPNIVSVYAIGSDHGIHYYAMQLITGASLADLLDLARSTSNTTERGFGTSDTQPNDPIIVPVKKNDPAVPIPTAATTLPTKWNAIVTLMGQAANALAHAHERGIVHRDVKPANCLVDAHGHLWLVDFGLARIANVTNLTRTGAMVGTLRYMAPEQVEPNRGVVDQRTDLYGLGATLYELLTRQPVFVAEDRGQLINAILNDEPIPPRQLVPSIPRDLETIMLKLIAKEPSERYRSAAEVAEEFARLLAGETIRARRPTLTQRASKWVVRNRWLSITLAAAVVGLIGLQTVNNLWLSRSNDAMRTERRAMWDAMNVFHLTFIEDKLARDGTLQADERKMLEEARLQFRRLGEFVPWTVDDRVAVARSWRRVGDIASRLGDRTEAMQAYGEAERVLSQLTEWPTDAIRERAATANNRGNLERHQGQLERAGQSYRVAATAWKSIVDRRDVKADDRAELAGVEQNQGLIWQLEDRHSEAVSCFQSAQTRYAQLARELSQRPDWIEQTASAGHNLARSLLVLDKLTEAETTLRDSLVLWENAIAFVNRPLDTYRRAERTRLLLVELLILRDQMAEATSLAKFSQTRLAPFAQDDSRPAFVWDWAAATRVLAESQWASPSDAQRELRRAIERLTPLAEHPDAVVELARSHSLLARIFQKSGKPQDAIAASATALNWAEQIAERRVRESLLNSIRNQR